MKYECEFKEKEIYRLYMRLCDGEGMYRNPR